MKIALDEKHWLNSDKYCYWITALVTPGEKSKKKTPYEIRVSGYARTFEDAVESYLNKEIRRSEAESLQSLRQDIQKIKEEVRGWKKKIS